MKKAQVLFCFLIQGLWIHAQTGQEILDRHFTSIGQDQWNQIRSAAVSGKWVDEDYHAYHFDLSYKTPGMIRIEGTYRGNKFVEIYDGKQAWIQAPWKAKGDVNMTLEEELVLRHCFFWGSPLFPRRLGLTFLGLEDINGELHNTFLIEEPEYRIKYYLDRNSDLLSYAVFKSSDNDFTVLMSIQKYKSYPGMVIPTAIHFSLSGGEREFVFDKVLLGEGVSDDLFVFPDGQ